jgi:hypothetical protein
MITRQAAMQISQQRISTLATDFRQRAYEWYAEMWKMRPILVTEGYRTMARQAELYAMGPKVTRAKPGESMHGFGLALDWCPLRPAIKAPDMYEADWDDEKGYQLGVEIGHPLRLVPISWETGHLQDGRYADWREARDAVEGIST